MNRKTPERNPIDFLNYDYRYFFSYMTGYLYFRLKFFWHVEGFWKFFDTQNNFLPYDFIDKSNHIWTMKLSSVDGWDKDMFNVCYLVHVCL